MQVYRSYNYIVYTVHKYWILSVDNKMFLKALLNLDVWTTRLSTGLNKGIYGLLLYVPEEVCHRDINTIWSNEKDQNKADPRPQPSNKLVQTLPPLHKESPFWNEPEEDIKLLFLFIAISQT